MVSAKKLLEQSLVLDGCQFEGRAFPETFQPNGVDGFLFTVHGGFREAAHEIGLIHAVSDGSFRVVRSVRDVPGGNFRRVFEEVWRRKDA